MTLTLGILLGFLGFIIISVWCCLLLNARIDRAERRYSDEVYANRCDPPRGDQP